MRQRTKKIKESYSRINVLIAIQLVVAVIFIARLFQIQVLQHEEYKVLAQDQYWSLQALPAKRGDIISSDGFPLATTQVAYLLYGEPDKILDPLQVSNDLANVLVNSRTGFYEDEIQKEALFENYKDRFYEVLSFDLRWAVLEHFLSESEKDLISNLNIVGVGFEEEPKRYYSEGELASHVLGFVAKSESGEEQGYFGIEGSFDGDLKGKSGRIIEERDATGAPILVGEYNRVNPIDGRDVILTLNRAIQYIVEKKLEEGVKEFGAVSGSVVVMDPMTGDVLAMANYPTYHPARFDDGLAGACRGVCPQENGGTEELQYTTERRNLAISETYEPGSVLKALTISAGIDSGKITPETTFEDSGPVVYSDYTIDNWDGKHHGTQNIVQLLQKSNNVGSAWVGHVLGSKTLNKYLNRFGMGEITKVDLEGEDTGLIRDYKDWTDIDLATIAFGQGISATPLQIINSFNAIANGGKVLRPRVVSKVLEDGDAIEIPVRVEGEVMSKESSETMIWLLTQAVSGGESKFYNIRNYDIAGKTGTAQIPFEGKYDPNKTNATFAGFLSNSKKFSMIVRLDRPSSSVYASETAVPLWMKITAELIKYFGIPPDST